MMHFPSFTFLRLSTMIMCMTVRNMIWKRIFPYKISEMNGENEKMFLAVLFLLFHISPETLSHLLQFLKLKSKQHRQWFSTMLTSYRYECCRPVLTCFVYYYLIKFLLPFYLGCCCCFVEFLCHRWKIVYLPVKKKRRSKKWQWNDFVKKRKKS